MLLYARISQKVPFLATGQTAECARNNKHFCVLTCRCISYSPFRCLWVPSVVNRVSVYTRQLQCVHLCCFVGWRCQRYRDLSQSGSTVCWHCFCWSEMYTNGL